MKVLYNTCYGGFNFSNKFVAEFNRRFPDKAITSYDEGCRSDPDAVALFEELGSEESSGHYAELSVMEIPDDVNWSIREYDGRESVQWDIPNDRIIQDLMDILKGRKKETEVSKFTQMMIQKDLTPCELRRVINSTSS